MVWNAYKRRQRHAVAPTTAELWIGEDDAPSPGRRASQWDNSMDELNGRMIACQILLMGLAARVANSSPDPIAFLSDFRDEIKAVVNQVRISGTPDSRCVRETAQATIDELFSLMKAPSSE
jgi:hypothetical protein